MKPTRCSLIPISARNMIRWVLTGKSSSGQAFLNDGPTNIIRMAHVRSLMVIQPGLARLAFPTSSRLFLDALILVRLDQERRAQIGLRVWAIILSNLLISRCKRHTLVAHALLTSNRRKSALSVLECVRLVAVSVPTVLVRARLHAASVFR